MSTNRPREINEPSAVQGPLLLAKRAPKIGIIMLNTTFARPVGDVGNIDSYRYDAQILQLTKAKVSNVVSDKLTPDVISEVEAAAFSLKERGVNIITTSCGFFAPIQQHIQARVGLPFIASSLGLIPFLRQIFGHQRSIGVLTFDSRVLSPAHFNGHYDEGLIISGIEQGQELHRVISNGCTTLDEHLAEQDVLQAAAKLIAQSPSCILLECTNLSPHKNAIRAKYQLPVFDLVDTVHWLADAY